MKRYLDIIVINLITLGIGILIFLFLGNRFEILAAIIATGISLSLGIRQYNGENDRIFKDLFTEFNRKYDEKFNDRFNSIIANSSKVSDYQLSPKDELLIIDYLNLCSEEYLWYQKNRIPLKVWNAWESAMIYFLNNPHINKVVLTQKGQELSYYGLFEKIGKKIQNWR
jgi:hypothetical protein